MERVRIGADGTSYFYAFTDPINTQVDGTCISLGNGIRGFMTATNQNPPIAIGRANQGHLLQMVKNSSTQLGSITTDGTNVAYTTTSDRRIKHGIETLGGMTGYLEEINFVKFQMSTDYNEDATDDYHVGVIADELQEVLPFLVFGEKDAVDEAGNIIPQTVNYVGLTPIIGRALQTEIAHRRELQEENRVLKLQMAAVLAKLELVVDTDESATTQG